MKKLLSIIFILIAFFSNAQTYRGVAPNEYATFYIDSTGKLWAAGGRANLWASNSTGRQALPTLVKQASGSAMPKFTKVIAGFVDALAIDTAGYVWHLGDAGSCAAGDGTTDPAPGDDNMNFAQRITVDSAGNTFTGITSAAQYFLDPGASHVKKGWFAIKGTDSTLWLWGRDDDGGFRGTGVYPGPIPRPVQVIIPGNRKVLQVVAGYFAMVLCSDGTVWTWGSGGCDEYFAMLGSGCSGTSFRYPRQVTEISGGRSIGGGRGGAYVICGNDSLWGWGGAAWLGTGTTNNSPIPPTYLTPYMPTSHGGVKKIVTNVNATHAIMGDSTLWGWGSSPQGEVGNGTMLDRDRPTYPWGYGWDFSNLWVTAPAQLVPTRHDFVNIYSANGYTYWFYDEAVNGQLYFNGRNKGAVGGNGVINSDTAGGNMPGQFDQSWNVPTSVPVNIFTLRDHILQPAPPCLQVGNSYASCAGYSAPANLPPTINAGTDQSGVGTTTLLTATSSPQSGRRVASYVWSQISGPTAAYFNSFNDSIASVSRLQAGGTYIFRITATDNFNSSATDDIVVTTTGGGGSNTPPVANAGSNQSITLPVNQVTLAGSGTDADGTIVSYSWAKISGSTANISNTSTATTNVTFGSISGARVFRLTVTDNQGATGTSDVTITVNAASGGSGNETNDMITYDTSVIFQGFGAWNIRITRPRNMFTAGHPDTASRPAIVFMVGVGEACNCPGSLGYYGPHAILGQGWNGGIQLGNGTHYPILISVQPWSAWPSTRSSGLLLEHLLNTYHIKRNSLHITGLSMGAMTWSRMMNAERTEGDRTWMKLVKSMTLLQGQGNAYYDSINLNEYMLGGDTPVKPLWAAYGLWAHQYGGKYFGLEGTNDYRDMGWIPQAMNDSSAGSAYRAFEDFNGGSHCCWNQMYDVGKTNWTSVGTLGSNVTTGYYSPNYMGTYHNGDNVFTWMLKQGDTSLAGFGGSGHQSPTVYAGNNLTITLPTTTASLSTGSATANNGGSITTYAWTQTGGTAATILSPATLVTNISGLSTAGVRTFTLTVTDNEGSTASADVTITVNAASGFPSVTTSDVSTTSANASLSSTITASAGVSTTRWTKLSVPGQTIKTITVIGSSTAAGNGTTNYDSSFVRRLRAYYISQGIIADITNLSVAGWNPDNQDITIALNYNSDVLLCSFPSNGYTASQNTYWLGRLQRFMDSTIARGKQFYITGTQPRNDYGDADRANLIVFNDSLRNRFGTRFIDFLTPLLNTTGNVIKAEYYADGIHPNNAGHGVIYEKVKAANIFQNVASSASLITSPGSANTNVSGLVNGVHKFQISVVDVNGFAASAVSNVTVNISTSNQSPSANAGANQTIYLPTSQVALTGSGTDPDGYIVSYAWTQPVGIPATIVSASSPTTNITGLSSAGTRVFRLTVTDNSGATGYSDVTITVNAQPNNSTGLWVVNGKYSLHVIDENGHVTAIGNRGYTGVGGNGYQAGSYGVPEPVFFPTNMKFKKGGAGHFHGAALIDTTGHVWTMGAAAGGESGMGNNTYSATPQKILTDTSGNAFDSVSSIVSLAVNGGEGSDQDGYLALKSTGTIWIWGTVGSMLATGTAGDTRSFYKPTRLIVPGNRSVMQIAGGYHCVILCTDSTVWTWGGIDAYDEPNLGYDVTSDNQIASLHQITIPGTAGAKYIAAGIDENYVVTSNNKLYGFGKYGVNMGNQSLILYTPTELTNITNVLPAPISKMAVSFSMTAALLTDGSLWTWGDNSQGQIGNGKQYYGFGRDTLHGYTWPFVRNSLTVTTPYHVAPTRTFNDVWGNNLLCFNTIALGSDGQLYEWGTSKGCTIMDGVSGPTSGNINYHDQSWNRYWPTPIYPFSITSQVIVTSPACKFGYSDSTACNTYDWRHIEAGIKPVAHTGPNITTNASNVTLDGSTSSDDVLVNYYEWSQVSGPNTAVIDLPAAKRPIVSNLITGTYVFKLVVIDNEWLYDSAYVQVAVNVTNQLPTAYAGADTSLVLPVTSIQLDGTGSTDNDGTIASYQWGQKSGPSALSFSSLSSSKPTLSGFIAGTYVIQLYVTDNSGGQSALPSLRTIVAAGNQSPTSSAGANQGITLPVTTVTLSGSGTDPDGTIASYAWSQVSGTTATITSPSSASTTITGLTTAGVRIFRLTVTDNGGATGTSDVQITVNPASTPPPTANAGPDQTITLPVTQVTLTGTATNAVSYRWNYVSGPFTGTISNQNGLVATIIFLYSVPYPSSPDVYVFSLTATDAQGRTATDSVRITVNPPLAIKNIPGRVEAESFDAKSGPMYAVSTTDVDGVQDIVGLAIDSYMDYNVTVATTGTYTVSFRVATYQSSAQFKIYKGATLLKTVNIPSSGDWNIWENVTATGISLTAGAQTLRIVMSSSDIANFNYTTWTLTTSGNQPPSANAGSNQAVLLPTTTATLTGSGSDPENGVLTYAWTQISGTTATISAPTSATTGITGLTTPGTRIFRLTVTDDGGLTAYSDVAVIVGEVPNKTRVVKGLLIGH